MKNIFILGSGGWGTALAVMCDGCGHKVTLWSKFPEEIERIKQAGENAVLLPKIKISETIGLTSSLEDLEKSDLIIIAVPSFAVRDTAKLIREQIGELPKTVAIVTKGLEKGSLKRMSQVVEEEIPGAAVVVVSGPSHAEEVARGLPTTVVAASKDKQAAFFVQDVLMNNTLRIYTRSDMVGVELCAALKNVIALAAGICDGLGLGDNTKAALITRGLAEIARLGEAMGANNSTFNGLAGIGDLIVTCTSMHSRNRRYGILIGKGNTTQEAQQKVGMTVEGYHAAAAAYELARRMGVEMPIVERCYKVLYQEEPAFVSVSQLMERPRKHESESEWE